MRPMLTYLFDPLCGWCYGAAPALERLRAEGVNLRLAPTGLFSDAGVRRMDTAFASFAWSNDQRIAQMTGQVFSEAYRTRVLGDRVRLFDSGPASLALTAVALAQPDREFEALKAFQAARYVEGLDITAIPALQAVLKANGLDEAAQVLGQSQRSLLDAHRHRLAEARRLMSSLDASGVPTLVLGAGDQSQILPAGALFGPADKLARQFAVGVGA